VDAYPPLEHYVEALVVNGYDTHRVEKFRRTLCLHGSGGEDAFRHQLLADPTPGASTGALYVFLSARAELGVLVVLAWLARSPTARERVNRREALQRLVASLTIPYPRVDSGHLI
jgi:hypothetical protein